MRKAATATVCTSWILNRHHEKGDVRRDGCIAAFSECWSSFLLPAAQSGQSGRPSTSEADSTGGQQALHDRNLITRAELRFLDALDATTRFGSGYRSGAILVTLRRR